MSRFVFIKIMFYFIQSNATQSSPFEELALVLEIR